MGILKRGGPPQRRIGLTYAVSAYLLWGFLPLYLGLLADSGPVEIIAHRVVWSLIICGLILVATGRLADLRRVFTSARQVGICLLAGLLVTGNWLIYVYAVLSDRVADAALGYFMNPLVSVGLGVVFLGERLRRAQWVAIAVAGVAIAVVAIGNWTVPWIALSLAVTFGLYGYVEKRLGASMSAATSLAAETLLVSPLAGAYLIWLAASGGQTFGSGGPWYTVGLISLGFVTAVPLLLFNGAARRLPLSLIGLLQYMCPVIQFTIAVAVLHEPMPTARWVGFAIVWVALIIITFDSMAAARRSRLPLPDLEARRSG